MITDCFCLFVSVSQLQCELDQEYQDKFRRLPMEIQEFVQDTAKGRLDLSKIPVSTTTERLNSKTSPSEEDVDESPADRVFDTPL